MRAFLALPLLGKELTEAAARRRTYVLRVVYAVLLYGFFALTMPRFFRGGAVNTMAMLGTGRQMIEGLLVFQLAAIILFLPALMCGRITEEKERDSLVLLFLTELGPWRIVFEKYLGGLVPMFTFLLLSAPLGAVAYAFGGFGLDGLLAVVLVLAVVCLQVGALALACSAWCRTTVAAFAMTYLCGLAVFLIPKVALYAVWEVFGAHLAHANYYQVGRWLDPMTPLALQPTLISLGVLNIIEAGPINLLSIPAFLVLARIGLVRRAFAPPSNLVRRIFRRLDAVMQRANRLVGNVMIVRPRASLPVDDPIAWREQARTGLGQPHYLLRILCAIEVPVALLCFLAACATTWTARQHDEFSVLMALVFGLAALFLCVQSANAFVAERVHQSLDVLLTTPLRAAQIVAGKARALHRLAGVLAIPILTVAVVEWCVESVGWRRPSVGSDGPLAYLTCVLLGVLIYLPLIVWLSLWIGLRARTRFKAIVTAVGVLVGWCVGPFAVVFLWDGSLDLIFDWPFLLSPPTLLVFNENSALRMVADADSPWLVIGVNFLIYFAILYLFRSLALGRADRYLRR